MWEDVIVSSCVSSWIEVWREESFMAFLSGLPFPSKSCEVRWWLSVISAKFKCKSVWLCTLALVRLGVFFVPPQKKPPEVRNQRGDAQADGGGEASGDITVSAATYISKLGVVVFRAASVFGA